MLGIIFKSRNAFHRITNKLFDKFYCTDNIYHLYNEDDLKTISNAASIDGNHTVHIIQPDIKDKFETANLRLQEAVALINTLTGWTVLTTNIYRLRHIHGKTIWGSGTLEKIVKDIKQYPSSAVLINMQMLNPSQIDFFTKILNRKIIDRYQVILKIFEMHAHTKEAKLQISLAQIPLLRMRYNQGIEDIGMTYEDLCNKEVKIYKQLQLIKKHRHFIKKNRIKMEIPIIAVVGYTNAGKTSLIKYLTKNDKLIPIDKLFATVEVTTHPCYLSNNINGLLVDTVGFITDLPTTLVESFSSTLETVTEANVILHVRDISHPNSDAQKELVKKTLNNLSIPDIVYSNIIEVCNKCDLINIKQIDCMKNQKAIFTSTKNGYGFKKLSEKIGNVILKTTDRKIRKFRIKNGGSLYEYLISQNFILDLAVDETDESRLIVTTALTDTQFSKILAKYKTV